MCPCSAGTYCTMSSIREKNERKQRALRLREARKAAGYKGPKDVCTKFGWNIDTYKAHEQGRNGFGIADARNYASAFDISVTWLNFGPKTDAYAAQDERIYDVAKKLQNLSDDDLAVVEKMIERLGGKALHA